MTGSCAVARVAARVLAGALPGVLGLLLIGCDANTSPEPSAPREAAVDRDAGAAGPPNLILITMDTTRADALGAYGQTLPTSPNVDRLTKRGVLFEQATSSHPETLPSHSTIFTGKWPYAHGVRSNAGYVLSDRNVTLAEILKGHGYATGAEVAAPVLRQETKVTQGFDHYRGAESPDVELTVVHYQRGERREETKMIRVGADITARGIEFLHEHEHEPFFLWLHYFDAHNPYLPPPRFRELIPQSLYHAEVASADFQIGLLLNELSQLGLRDRTLVVLTADHGEGLMEHGEPSHSFFVYETTMHVPLVFAGLPELPQGIRIASLVRTADVTPTVLDLLGLPPLEGVQGVSLVPLIQGAKADLELAGYGEATRFTSTFGFPPIRFLREGHWKYIHKVNPELYDLASDPHELTNVADRNRERVQEMRARLEALIAEAPEPIDDAQAALDAQTAMQLMALGYVAKSPAFKIEDEPASLVLAGEDPRTKIEDIQTISTAGGLLWRNEYASALELIEPLFARNPESTFVMDIRAQALVGVGRYDEGIALLRRILEREPDNDQASYSLAGALREAGRPADASQILGGLLARSPCDERVHIDLSVVLRELGRHEELIGVLARGAERCPEMLSNLNNYAWALATLPEDELRDGVRAQQVIRSAIDRSHKAEPDPAYLDTLAAALAEAGDFDEAIRVTSGLIEQLESASATDPALDSLRAHVEAYRAGRGVRDPERGGASEPSRSAGSASS